MRGARAGVGTAVPVETCAGRITPQTVDLGVGDTVTIFWIDGGYPAGLSLDQAAGGVEVAELSGGTVTAEQAGTVSLRADDPHVACATGAGATSVSHRCVIATLHVS